MLVPWSCEKDKEKGWRNYLKKISLLAGALRKQLSFPVANQSGKSTENAQKYSKEKKKIETVYVGNKC